MEATTSVKIRLHFRYETSSFLNDGLLRATSTVVKSGINRLLTVATSIVTPPYRGIIRIAPTGLIPSAGEDKAVGNYKMLFKIWFMGATKDSLM